MSSYVRVWIFLLPAAFILYASFHPAYFPLKAMLTERFLESQGRAAWQIEQKRKEEARRREAQEKARIDANYRKLVADGQRLLDEIERINRPKREAERKKREAEEAERLRIAEEERKREEAARQREEAEKARLAQEEYERQQRIAEEERKKAEEERKRKEEERAARGQAIEEELNGLLQDAYRLAESEIKQIEDAKSWLPRGLLKYLNEKGVSYADIRASNACTNFFSMSNHDLYFCAAHVYDSGNSSLYSADKVDLMTLAVSIANGNITADFNLSKFIAYVQIKRAMDENYRSTDSYFFPPNDIDKMIGIAPSKSDSFIKQRLTFADEQYLLNDTIKKVEQAYSLKRERDGL